MYGFAALSGCKRTLADSSGRICTAEVRGSNPLGSTQKIGTFAGKTVIQAQLIEYRAVDPTFLSAFRFAMYISAGMVDTSAIAAALLIQGKGKKGNEPGRSGPHAGG